MGREPILAAILNFAWPGLGTLYNYDSIRFAGFLIVISSFFHVDILTGFDFLPFTFQINIYIFGVIQGAFAVHGFFEARRINFNRRQFIKSVKSETVQNEATL